jgi:uncharacterized protein (DUF736 family)
MSAIGNFVPAKDGGWISSIRTLTIDAKVRFVHNDDRHSINAPSFQIFVGQNPASFVGPHLAAFCPPSCLVAWACLQERPST